MVVAITNMKDAKSLPVRFEELPGSVVGQSYDHDMAGISRLANFPF